MGIHDVGSHPGGELHQLVLPFPICRHFALEVGRAHPPERIGVIPRMQADVIRGLNRAIEIGLVAAYCSRLWAFGSGSGNSALGRRK